MADRQKVIKGLEDIQRHLDTGYSFAISWESELIRDVISLLKEDCHNCKLECLLQKYDELKEKYENLLKEQDAKPDKCIICEGCGHKLQDDWNWCPWCRWETVRGRRVRSDGF